MVTSAAIKPKQITGEIRHAPQLHHPWFATHDEGMTLHRYFDDQFVPRFVQEAMSNQLTGSRDAAWYNTDRFGYQDLPTLRLPMHETFYIACAEVSCHQRTQPAYDPKKIRSAGFVIRRRTAAGETQRWMLQGGQTLGWQTGSIPEQEPDDYRRFVNRKLLPPQFPEPGYSGEETYPLHSLVVRSKQGNQNSRSRNLLWGYVPLGGNHRVSSQSTTNASVQPSMEATQSLRYELSWPFGERDAHGWIKYDNRPAFQGRASIALYELLEVLLTRYRVFESGDSDNSQLRSQLAAIHFYNPITPHFPQVFDPYAVPVIGAQKDSLLSWIESSSDALLVWISNIATGKATPAGSPLPIQTGLRTDGSPISIFRMDDLYINEQQTESLRDLLLIRGGQAMARMDEGVAMPRFGQSDDDRFYLLPFIRWIDDCGCEQIQWGQQSSINFRVLSPLDPEAQRPRAIILPGLNDIKRGTAKGVTMMAPKSLANLLRKIMPNMDMGTNGPGNPTGLCWNFSFSIPVITICAMILLMIIMNLLNIVFFWLPWAFMALPRLCGKLLSEK